MSNFNHPQMPLDGNPDPKNTSDQLNQSETISAQITPTTTPIEVNDSPPSTIEISVTPENDPVTSRDWFNLARKLRGQNRELLESIVQLEQSLAESQQQLQEQGQQARRNDFLLTQQTTQVDTIKAQFQTAQKQFQQQQQELTTLQEKLATTQSQLAHVERQCTLLKQRYQEKANRLEHSQKQVEELQARLQRQQRYSLQYKAALDECLGKSTKKQVQPSINSHSLSSTKISPPKITSINSWSEKAKAQKVSESVSTVVEPKTLLKQIVTSNSPRQSELLSSLEDLDKATETLPTLALEKPEVVKQIMIEGEESLNKENPKAISANVDPKSVANHDVHSHKMVTSMSQELTVQPSVTFSFDINCNKPHDQGKIDLPSFLSRRHK
ncbi:hypothetical protein [Cyanobacterium sp. uoEpiScrs1]|uniref:hypothetical protein n=1 Tax=Cyanobacterium sp. uoEpiScrs1 TaxID=2976343 RepID=UPI002269ABEA|nr:hypothetical protein [Cyanobacterium sp. uoEpiScrs1]